nr:SH3 and multiple ankyrin repeat domains protein 2-like [Aedes albopictus]
MSTSSYISHSAAPSGPGSSTRDGNNNDNDSSSMDGDNLLKLALKKPKAWKWELTTSSSSPSIAFPKIQLFDSRTGELMVQVDKPDCVVKSEELAMGRSDGLERSRSLQDRKGRDQRYRRSRSTCIREKVTTSSDYLSDVFAQLQNKGMGHKLATSVTQYRVEETEEDVQENGYGLQKSQSAREIRRSSSVEQKKKILRTPSTRSGSMLGRISECFKSSTEEEPPRQSTPPPPPAPAPTIPEISVEEEPEPKPTTEENKNKIYKLVRSNVGTLIVREESFHTQRSLRRRRQQLQEQPSIPESEPQVDKRITISDIPDSSYNDTIREIDSLISKVMLSHNLQDVHESRPHQSRGRPSTQQNGDAEPVRKRRARRSASAGSNASSYAGSSGSRRSRNSPLVTVPTGSSSSDEDLVAMAESRFGSLKRRGRAKYKRNSTGQVHEVYSGSAGAQVNGVSRQHETNGE